MNEKLAARKLVVGTTVLWFHAVGVAAFSDPQN